MPRRLTVLTAAIALCLTVVKVEAQDRGLKLRADHDSTLQMRINLLSSDENNGSRVMGAQLLGDYYLLSSGSGVRLSGGLLVGPQSLIGTGLAPSRPGLLGFGSRRLGGVADDAVLNQPYLGIGFSRHSNAWGVTADLGVAVNGAVSLRTNTGSTFAQSLDDSLRRLQWTPMLQLGVSYRF
jgi:hypothetical protein